MEGYTFAITGAVMTLNEQGKWVGTFLRPEEDDLQYVTVTYSPIASQEPTEEPAEEPAEELTTTVVVISADLGGVMTFEDKVYTYTWAEEETEKTVSFQVPSVDGYAYMVFLLT